MTFDVDRVRDDLGAWLPSQRWFAGKNRPVAAVRLDDTVELGGDAPGGDDGARLLHAVATVEYGDGGEAERYQLVLGARRELPDLLGHAVIGHVDGTAVYDAVHDSELCGRLLALIAGSATVGSVRFAALPDADIDASLRARPVGAEQSNTSIVYGGTYILKLFRRLQPGVNPDVELHEALHGVGSAHLARPYGSITGVLDGVDTTLGMLVEFLPTAAEGWAMAKTSVRDLMAEGDLHADEVGGDFAGEARRLGHAVAAVHADLATVLGSDDAPDDAYADAAAQMRARLDGVLATVPGLAPHADGLRAAFDAITGLREPLRLQRVHGDLHLGQVLRTPLHWVLIDFEGEPAAPVERRRRPASPLRDVASMLRSFDYAAYQLLVEHDLDEDTDRQLTFRAVEWARRNRDAFCDGYGEVASDPREHAVLLRALELDKAVYEVGYEAANRPDWLAIPLASIGRLLAA